MSLIEIFVVFVLAQDRVIPSGANIIVPIYSMGHDERYFSDPEAFKPERFSEERSAEKQNPFTYIPFSAGKSIRVKCILWSIFLKNL